MESRSLEDFPILTVAHGLSDDCHKNENVREQNVKLKLKNE